MRYFVEKPLGKPWVLLRARAEGPKGLIGDSVYQIFEDQKAGGYTYDELVILAKEQGTVEIPKPKKEK